MKYLKNEIDRLVRKFATKQDLVFDGWISDEIGGIAIFNDLYYFSLSDIIIDMEGIESGIIKDWYDNLIENCMEEYRTYLMGLRIPPCVGHDRMSELEETNRGMNGYGSSGK